MAATCSRQWLVHAGRSGFDDNMGRVFISLFLKIYTKHLFCSKIKKALGIGEMGIHRQDSF
jgi:hypothetical protein